MKIVTAPQITAIQGKVDDNRYDVLKQIREQSTGVDKLARIRRVNPDGSILDTFWFKGHNGSKDVRWTYQTVVN